PWTYPGFPIAWEQVQTSSGIRKRNWVKPFLCTQGVCGDSIRKRNWVKPFLCTQGVCGDSSRK
ncbi:hypothetical protein MUG91_G52n1, partial [Manis pentadactyla]